MPPLTRITIESDDIVLRYTQREDAPFCWGLEQARMSDSGLAWLSLDVEITGHDVLWSLAALAMKGTQT